MMKRLMKILSGGFIFIHVAAFVCKPLGPPEEVSRLLSRPFPEDMKKQFPGGWEDLVSTVERTQFVINTTLGSGIRTYIEFTGELPNSLEEVCKGSYIPFPCEQILNPFTQKPILETPRGQWGHVEYTPTKGKKSLRGFLPLTVTLPNFLEEGNLHSIIELNTYNSIHYTDDFVPWSKLGFGPEWITAFSTSAVISGSMSYYWYCTGGTPNSFNEMADAFPYLRNLRNGFTGGYARLIAERRIPADASPAVEKQVMEEVENFGGTPGDFAIVWNGFTSRVIVYGKDGRGISKTHEERLLAYKGIDPRTNTRIYNRSLP